MDTRYIMVLFMVGFRDCIIQLIRIKGEFTTDNDLCLIAHAHKHLYYKTCTSAESIHRSAIITMNTQARLLIIRSPTATHNDKI